MKRSIGSFLFLMAFLAGVRLAAGVQAGPVPDSEVEALLKNSSEKHSGKIARRYQDQFLKAIDPILLPAMKTCTSKTADTVEPGSVAFVIAKDGHVKRILWSAKIPMGECVGEKLRSITKLPPPPEDNWVEGVGVANHSKAVSKAPVDKPMKTTNAEQTVAYEKAIAPYVAKARATYPGAKKRFLAGLPPGYRLFVRARFFDRNGVREDSFVEIKKISGGKIAGVLGTVDLLKDYKTGQSVTIKESEIDNWLIVRPDGSEEGNYVGKFLDTYKSGQ